jgi:hypothetical protein
MSGFYIDKPALRSACKERPRVYAFCFFVRGGRGGGTGMARAMHTKHAHTQPQPPAPCPLPPAPGALSPQRRTADLCIAHSALISNWPGGLLLRRDQSHHPHIAVAVSPCCCARLGCADLPRPCASRLVQLRLASRATAPPMRASHLARQWKRSPWMRQECAACP